MRKSKKKRKEENRRILLVLLGFGIAVFVAGCSLL